MTDIDRRISDSLDADDRAFLASLDEGRGLFLQIGDTLGGPLAGWTRLAAASSIAVTLGAVFAAWQLLTVQDTRALVLWAVAVLAALLVQGFIKLWFFSRMNMLAILREVRRLHVQVALLAEEKR